MRGTVAKRLRREAETIWSLSSGVTKQKTIYKKLKRAHTRGTSAKS